MNLETNDTEYKRELTDGLEREVVEQLGSGMPRILSAYGRAAFEFGSRHVRIKMPISLEAQQVERELEVESLPKNDQNGADNTVEKTVEKTREKTIALILSAIRENPRTTTADLAELTGLSVKGVEWNLAQLKSRNVIRRVGPDKGGHWEVVE